jgi:hypothetical protein
MRTWQTVHSRETCILLEEGKGVGETRSLHSKELRNSFSSPNIVRVIKLSRMRPCGGHESRTCSWNYKFIWKYEGKILLYIKKFRGFESASELYRSSDRRRSAKLVSTLEDRGCHVVSATSPSYSNFDFLDLEPLLFLPSSSLNCSWGWVDPVPDPLLFRNIWQRQESNTGPLC